MAVLDSEFLLHYYLRFLLFLVVVQSSVAHVISKTGVKTEVFVSPKFVLGPGSVSNKYYYDIDFPRGHIAVKSFNAEVVDEGGNPVPLHETYLHHWIVVRYYQRRGERIQEDHDDLGLLKRGERIQEDHDDLGLLKTNFHIIKNNGVCDHGLVQYFGLGSETRRTATEVPDPYGIEVGSPADAPDGYEEQWLLNVHAIDTRGAEDKLGCTECRCDLYNITLDAYNGGLRCCHDGAKCKVKEGFRGVERGLYLRYTVTYVDWDTSIIPVEIYILDVTDVWTKAGGLRARHRCLIEYEVESCGVDSDGCTHTKTLNVSLPTGGDVIYGVGHQHAGGLGLTLYGEGGREICSSIPSYGNGDEPGNEAGYIVGMSTCYPLPGSLKISAGETLNLLSNYSSAKTHTGVMGLFYLLVADSSPKRNTLRDLPTQEHRSMMLSNLSWSIVLFGVGLILSVVFLVNFWNLRGEGYERV